MYLPNLSLSLQIVLLVQIGCLESYILAADILALRYFKRQRENYKFYHHALWQIHFFHFKCKVTIFQIKPFYYLNVVIYINPKFKYSLLLFLIRNVNMSCYFT